ncbi:hypothetical protein DPMN_176925 [Dreissena polymorpha]|uniref:Uncharacterized protein n=1 Tax=Dreissena polymorpha TaxID=45954 RepID=A0A9D4IK28_DREPO|nr:hypothetical protein DPMN_176925 [Dreissena polymorpha]
MLRGLEHREREPWRALSVFEPSNVNFSLINTNYSILYIPLNSAKDGPKPALKKEEGWA